MKLTTKTLLVSLMLLLFVVGVYAKEEARISKVIEYKVKQNAKLILQNVAGPVTIESWGKSDIQIKYTIVGLGDSKGTAEKDAKGIKVEADKSGNLVKVKVKYAKKGLFGAFKKSSKGYVIFDVRVPASCNLDISNVSGKTYISGITAGIESENVSGNTYIKKSKGKFTINSVSGDTHLLNNKGKAYLSMVSGDITISVFDGNLNIESVSGDATIEKTTIRSFSIESISGDITFNSSPKKTAEMEFETISGDMNITLPENMGVEYILKSFSGDLKIFLPDGNKKFATGKIKGKWKNNDTSLDISTMSGDVKVVIK